jgi:TRAP-type C4-dicarboxylate transport system permease small subunit
VSIFATIVRKVGHRAMVLSSIFLLGMMLLIVTNVTIRPFGAVFAGTYELIEALIIVVVAGALGYTEMEKGHVTVQIIVSRFPQRLQGVFETFIYLIGVGLWVVITWASIAIMRERWLNEDTEVLSVPILPFRFIWVFGLIFFCSVLLVNLFKGLSQAVKK